MTYPYRLMSYLMCLTLLLLAQLQLHAANYTFNRIGVGGGGFHTGIIFNSDGSHAYVRGDVFGLHRYDFDSTKPGGGTWKQLLDAVPTTNVDGIATDPGNPAVIYALLGDTTYGGSANFGLWKSSNYGNNWTQLKTLTVYGNQFDRQEGEPLAVDPFNSDIVYMATRENGLFIITGATSATPTFTSVSTSSVPVGGRYTDTTNSGNNQPLGIRNVIIDPTTSISVGGVNRAKNVYVCVHADLTYNGSSTSSANNGGIWASHDGGQSWTQITAANTPTTSVVRFGILSDGSLLANGLRYSVSANSWTNITPDNKGGWGGLGVDPTNLKRIIVSTVSDDSINHPYPDNYYWTDDATVASPTWHALKRNGNGTNAPDNSIAVLYTQPWFQSFAVYTDCFAFNPANHNQIWSSDVFNVQLTYDITQQNPNIWQQRSEGLGSTVAHEVCNPKTGGCIVGVEDVGALDLPDPTVDPIQSIAPDNAQYASSIDSCEAQPNYRAIATHNAFVNGFRIAVSTDGVHYSKRPAPSGINDYTYVGYTAIRLSSTNPDDAVLVNFDGGNTTVWITNNLFSSTTPTWYQQTSQPHTDGLPNANPPVASTNESFTERKSFIADPVDGTTFYYIGDTNSWTDGNYVSYASGTTQLWVGKLNDTTHTLTWTKSGVALGQGYAKPYEHELYATPGVSGDIWALDGNGLYHTINAGASWTQVVVAPSKPISFALGAPAPGTTTPTLYYAGQLTSTSGYAISRSTNLGGSWDTVTNATFTADPVVFIYADRANYGRVYIRRGSTGLVYADDTAYPVSQKGYQLIDDHSSATGFTLGTNGSKTSGWAAGRYFDGSYDQWWISRGSAAQTESVVYNYNNIFDFKFDVYVNEYLSDPLVVNVSTSPDGQQWTPISVNTSGYFDHVVNPTGLAASGTTPSGQIPAGTNYIKIDLGDATNTHSGALGIVYINYLNTSTNTSVAPTITTQPANTSVASGSTATFSVVASGTPTPTYQWQKAPAGSATYTAITGATGSSYTTAATTSADNGCTFKVVVTNSAGSVTSSAATLTVTSTAPTPYYDGFNYTVGDLNGQGGWTGGAGSIVLLSGGLSYTDSASNTLTTAGTSKVVTEGYYAGATRALGSTFNQANTTSYVSFLAQGGNDGTIQLIGGGSDKMDINLAQYLGVYLHTSGQMGQSSATASSGTTNFVVVRMDTDSTGNNVRVRMYVNPSLTAEPTTPQVDTGTLNGYGFTYNTVGINGGYYGYASVDELHVGNTYADVTPHASAASSLTFVDANATSATANLTTLGTTDWREWGFSGTNSITKSGGGTVVSNYTVLTAGTTVYSYTNNLTPFSWTNGSPTASNSGTTTGIYDYAVNNGFKVTLASSSTSRKATVYVGGWNSSGQLTASFADGSATPITSTVASGTGQYFKVYTITYKSPAASPLNVTWKQTAGTGGNVTLNAVAVQ